MSAYGEDMQALIAELEAENERLRDALEAIKRHQRIAGGPLSSASTTFLIADAALRNDAMKE